MFEIMWEVFYSPTEQMFTELPPTFITERSNCFTVKESLGVKYIHREHDEDIGIKEGPDFYDSVDIYTCKRY